MARCAAAGAPCHGTPGLLSSSGHRAFKAPPCGIGDPQGKLQVERLSGSHCYRRLGTLRGRCLPSAAPSGGRARRAVWPWRALAACYM